MLTEPDMQARYVAAALAVIEAELRKADCEPGALLGLAANAARIATRLADDLERPSRRTCEPVSRSAAPASASNVIAFRHRA